ncbi:acyl carrier protein [Sphaerisporangium album]|uniref:Acyl carrier protein n=1 Tax=Sphaerisporangium album TaxID=509200 RepID=A0A367FA87_9ACTN|nr:acyl carrier protein [Sphaerisporangium album]RCG27283.1 acyl carrier protein [Sphaerisporangium album]
MSSSTEQAVAAEAISADLLGFVERQTKASVTADLDLFGSGLVSSLFAMQLVVHVESTFGVSVQGEDLKLDNFRTVNAITDLVLRLRGNGDG